MVAMNRTPRRQRRARPSKLARTAVPERKLFVKRSPKKHEQRWKGLEKTDRNQYRFFSGQSMERLRRQDSNSPRTPVKEILRTHTQMMNEVRQIEALANEEQTRRNGRLQSILPAREFKDSIQRRTREVIGATVGAMRVMAFAAREKPGRATTAKKQNAQMIATAGAVALAKLSKHPLFEVQQAVLSELQSQRYLGLLQPAGVPRDSTTPERIIKDWKLMFGSKRRR